MATYWERDVLESKSEHCITRTFDDGMMECLCGQLYSTMGKFAEHVEATKSEVPRKDVVNHPSHYTFGRFEVIDVIEDWKLPFHLANVVKYVARAAHKGNELQDLRKSAWYLDRYIKKLESK